MHDDVNFRADATGIRSLLAGTDPAPAELGAAAATRLSRIRTGILGSGTSIQAPARIRRPRTAFVMAGAAAAAVVAVVAASLGSGTGQSPTGPGGPPTAAQLLSKIATVASREPSPRVTDSEFSYIASQDSYSTSDDVHPDPPAPEQTHLRQIWIPVADLCGPGLLIENGKKQDTSERTVATPVAGDAGKAKAKDAVKVEEPDGKGWHTVQAHCPDHGSLDDPTYRLLQSLPTDPQALLKLIYKAHFGGLSPAEQAFSTIGDLLRESIAPPEVSAALYRAAALIPGVTVIPGATDAIGRPGVGVSFTFQGYQQEWIFDQSTLALLGERDYTNGTLTGKTAIITRAFTDRPGEVPPGS